MSKIIPLTQGQFAIVSDEDFPRLGAFKWHAVRMKRKNFPDYFYAARTKNRKRIWMHCEIIETAGDVDHVDSNGLNNQRHNLRPATRTQNCQNRRYADKGLPRGVSIQNGKFRARIALGNNKNKSLGMFDTPEAAALAYDQASLKLYGAFGIRNGAAS